VFATCSSAPLVLPRNTNSNIQLQVLRARVSVLGKQRFNTTIDLARWLGKQASLITWCRNWLHWKSRNRRQKQRKRNRREVQRGQQREIQFRYMCSIGENNGREREREAGKSPDIAWKVINLAACCVLSLISSNFKHFIRLHIAKGEK
jgi:hypothetical protein